MSYKTELIQVAAVALAMIQDIDLESTELDSRGYDHFDEMIGLLLLEREAQERKWVAQHHSPEKWMTILVEEVGEIANAILGKEFS